MKPFLVNLINGVTDRLKKMVYRPYSKFDISWLKEKTLKHTENKSVQSHLYKNKYKVSFTDARAFLLSIRELFIEETYKFRTEKKSPYIIDCGSHIGMSLLYFKLNFPEARVLGFEPDEHNFSLTQSNLLNWNFENIEVINEAIWIENGTICFHETGDMGSAIVTESTNNSSIKKIPCTRLKDLLNEKVDFLKMDIEGAEYEVLKDCSDSLMNVENLFIEYHGNYNEMHKLTSILQLLTDLKFAFYIKEAGVIYERPFWDRVKTHSFDVQLNISAFRHTTE
jgi:FkbM family methyltransferase